MLKKNDLLLSKDEEYKIVHRGTNMNIATRRFMADQATLKCLKEIDTKLFWIFTNTTSAKSQAEDCYKLSKEIESVIKEME